MKRKTIWNATMAAAVVLALAALPACGSSSSAGDAQSGNSTQTQSETSAAQTASYITPKAAGGKIFIDAEQLTSSPLYVNYDANGTTIQLIAVKSSADEPRLSLNTCQVCTPSPKAYFLEKDGKLVCQNCGNAFSMDSVGEDAGGCNPLSVDYKVADGKIVVKTVTLEKFASNFKSWAGPTEA